MNPQPNVANFALQNIWGIVNVATTWIEIHALYRCPLNGVPQRGWTYQFHRDGFAYFHPLTAFTDTNVEHQYAVVHYHNTTLTCSSLGDDNSWFVTQDGIKVGCAGFHDLQFAPHFTFGEFGLEINNGTYGQNKNRDHYYREMQYFNGVTWPWVDRDAHVINWQPAGGRGPGTSPRNWWRACSGFSATCL